MDTMKVTILDSGIIKIETDQISQANHMTAEAFMRNVRKAAGGTTSRKNKGGVFGAARHAIKHGLGMGHKH